MFSSPLQRTIQRSRSTLISTAAAALALLGLSLGYLGLSNPVRVSADGESFAVRTTGRTPEMVLRDAGIQSSEDDQVGSDPTAGRISWVELQRARPVLIQNGADRSWVSTASAIPANILAEVGVELYPGDRVWVDGLPLDEYQSAGIPPARIRIEPGLPARVLRPGSELVLQAAMVDPAQSLLEAGVLIHEADEVRLIGMTEEDGQELVEFGFDSGRPIEVHADGQVLHTWVKAETVAQALAEVGSPLVGLDRANPAAGAPLPRNGVIEVTRVREEVVTELEPVPFETNFLPIADLEIDTQRIIDTGSYGVLASQLRIRYENGEEVDRTVEGEWLAREPEPRVVGYGTNIVIRSVSTEHGSLEYWRAVQMWATSYSPSRAGTPLDAPNFGITASGKKLVKGLVAIDRTLIPFGTRMYVPGYGFAEAADTGSGIRGRWIDLGYEDHNWVGWAQYVTVYFLTPVPDPSSIVWILP